MSLPQMGMNDKAIHCAALQVNVHDFNASHYMHVHYSVSSVCVSYTWSMRTPFYEDIIRAMF